MGLNKDDFCDECWAIVSGEIREVKSGEGKPPSTIDSNTVKSNTTVKSMTDSQTKSGVPEKTSSGKFPGKSHDSRAKTAVSFKSISENQVLKSDEAETFLSGKLHGTINRSDVKNNISSKSVGGNRPLLSKLQIGAVLDLKDSSPEKQTVNKTGITFGGDEKSLRSLGVTSMKSPKSNFSSKIPSQLILTLSMPSVLTSQSENLYGAAPSDSDLCLDCLINQHRKSFEKNLLRNVYGAVEKPHHCRMISVQKHHKGRYMQVCSDLDCPRFRFWKIVDSGGAGWKVDSFLEGSPPTLDIGGPSCFVTADNLCSKEQMVDLSQVGLSPRIMDEVRPHIEVSEWFCGQGNSTSRYGFKVSLLDNRQLMKYVYGECKTLGPPEAQEWHKVTFTFQNYDPGVRYVLFHHGGQGEGVGNAGSKMAGASVLAKLPRGSQLSLNL